MSNQVLVVNGLNKEGERITLFRLEGFEVNLRVDNHYPQFPYHLGDETFVKVYDPQEGRDCDNDIKAWRFGFTVTKTQISGSDIFVYGFSQRHGLGDIELHLCDETEDHLPWEHDGMCGYDRKYRYVGPVELCLHQWGKEKPLAYEFHESLGGEINILEKVKQDG